MARTKFKNKIGIKQILCAALVIIISVSVIGGVSAFAKRDTNTISPTAFSVGGLDENGKYIKDEQSIVTEKAFECIGLRVVPEFTAQVIYDVYYYDYDERLVSSKIGLTEVYDEDFPLAKLARIVIHPEIPSDTNKKDFKIRFWQTIGYANDLKITVDKNQEYKYESINLYNESEVLVGMDFANANHKIGETYLELEEKERAKVTQAIPVQYEYYDIFVRYGEIRDVWTFGIAATADGIITALAEHHCQESELGEWVKITLEIPDDGITDHIRVRLPDTAECYLFGYNE